MSRKWINDIPFSISPMRSVAGALLLSLTFILISHGHAQPIVAEPPTTNLTSPSVISNTTAPEAPDNSRGTLIKGVGAAAICVEVLLSGFVPQLLLRVGPRWLGLANAFGGGIFLGATFFYLLPEVSFSLHGVVPKGGYPLGALLILAGYLAILCFERVLFQHKHHHHGASDRADDHDHGDHDHPHDHDHHDHDHKHEKKHKDKKRKRVTYSEDVIAADNAKHAQRSPATSPKTPLLASPETSGDVEAGGNSGQDDSKFQRKALFASLLVFLMLTVHSTFEGIVLGVSEDDEATIAILIAIISHKWVESLSLGIIMIKEELRRVYFIILIVAFSLLTPLGITIGALASKQMSESVVSAFNAIATGTFFYIGTTEILAEEFHTHAHKRLERWLKFFALFIGCTLMAVVRIWTGDEDHAGHSHDH